MAFSVGTEIGRHHPQKTKDEEDEEDEEYSEAFSPALLPILTRPLWLVRNGAVNSRALQEMRVFNPSTSCRCES